MKKIFLFFLFISFNNYSQNIITNNNLIIEHNDITLYLTKDTCTLASKHIITYENYLKLDSERNTKWFQDHYKGKYKKEYYNHTGYDLGHLTPSHITSYNNQLNHDSFSLFNQAPQIASFNRGKWARLEKTVENIISKNKKDATIITGVIYNPNKNEYLPKSRIPIPTAYFKVIFINGNSQCWVGSNINGLISEISLEDLNQLFKTNKMEIKILMEP